MAGLKSLSPEDQVVYWRNQYDALLSALTDAREYRQTLLATIRRLELERDHLADRALQIQAERGADA